MSTVSVSGLRSFIRSHPVTKSLALGMTLLIADAGSMQGATLYVDQYVTIIGPPSITIIEGNNPYLTITLTTTYLNNDYPVFGAPPGPGPTPANNIFLTPKSAALVSGSGSDDDNVVSPIPLAESSVRSVPAIPSLQLTTSIFQLNTNAPDYDNDYYTWIYTLTVNYNVDFLATTESKDVSWNESITVVDPAPIPGTLPLFGSALLGLFALSRHRSRGVMGSGFSEPGSLAASAAT